MPRDSDWSWLRAAVGLWGRVVDLACRGGLVAAAREAAAHNTPAERPRPTDKSQGLGIPLPYVLSAEDVALPPGEYRWDRFAERAGPGRAA